ncbi:MAG: TetR/AcrR family transcriptional regulator [Clostridium perfringens]|nr:TetR/AcrR family transcriptional regulator [Clostridium perfringens]
MRALTEKKKDIMDATLHLFSVNGYTETSMQDIASYCNISKATIYKFFKSKEELLAYIVKYLHEETINILNEINSNNSLNSKEKFEKKIFLLFNDFVSKKDFAMSLIESDKSFKNTVVEDAFDNGKKLFYSWLKDAICEYFGDSVNSIILDLTCVLNGILREFITASMFDKLIIDDFNKLSTFIVDSLIAVHEFHINEEPIIKENCLKFLSENDKFERDKNILFDKWHNFILKSKNIINLHDLDNKDDILNSLELLDEEFNKKEDARYFLVNALFLYLKNVELLSSEINILQIIWTKLNGRKI